MSDKKFYVYVHRYASGPKEGQVFYVGKGSGKRYKSKSRSYNPHWVNVVNKYGYTYEIVFRFKEEKCAFSLERALIAFYGRENLTNLTDGGDGMFGHISGKRIEVFCSNGMKFSSVFEAKEWLISIGHKKASDTAICNCANGKTKFSYGLGWSYISVSDALNKTLKKKSVYCSNGMTFYNQADAAEWVQSNMSVKDASGSISIALSGKAKSAYGLTWSYDHPPKHKPMKRGEWLVGTGKRIMCSNGMKFDSLKSARDWVRDNVKKTATSGCISSAANGMYNTAYGFTWKYLDDL